MRALPKRIEVVDDQMAEVYRGMTPARRLQVASDLYASARRMLVSHLRAEHPEWSTEEIRREAVRGCVVGGIDGGDLNATTMTRWPRRKTRRDADSFKDVSSNESK